LSLSDRNEISSGIPGRHIETLPCGLTILLQEVRQYPVVLFDMWVRTGSRDEQKNEWGLSHFLEHMVFNGNEDYSKEAYGKTLFGLGGEDNACTWNDATDFYIMVPSEHFTRGLDLIRSLILSPILSDEEFEREREVILEEIRIYEDDPEETLNEKTENTLFSHLGYNHPILGTAEILNEMDASLLRDYYQRNYVPGRMLLVIVGDFVLEEKLKEVRDAFCIPDNPSAVKPKAYEQEPEKGPRIIRMSGDIETSYLSIAFAGPPLKSMETFALDVLMETLGGCRSSRLSARIFEQLALVTEIEADNSSFMDAGKLTIEAELKDSANLQPVIDETFRIISEVISDGLTDDEIERAKRRLLAERLFSSERIFGIGELYGQDVLLCDIDFADKYAERILSVTPDQVLNVARKYLRPENMVLGFNYPEADGEIEISIEQFRPDEHEAGKPEIPYGVIISDFSVPPIRSGMPGLITREFLPNGVVWLHQHNPIMPTVSIQVFIRGGLAYESRSNNGIGEMTHRALWKGTREMSAKELSLAIDGLGATLETDCDNDFFSIQSSFLSRDFETGFRLISEMTLHPSFPESEFEKIRDEVLGVITQVMDDTDEVSLLKLLEEIFGLDHPYGRPTCGRIETVRNLAPDNIREFHRLITDPANIVVSVVGDVDAVIAGKLVEKYFGDLSPSDTHLPDINPPSSPDGLKTIVEYRDKSQVRISMGRPGPSLSDPDFAKAKMMSTILGYTSYSRLFMSLREELGLVYDVYTMLQRGRSSSLLYAYAGTSPDTCSDAIEAIRSEYRRLIDEGPTAGEIRNARSWLRGNTLIWHQGNHAIAESLGANEVVGMPYDFDFRVIDEYEKVTDSDVIAAAEKYADPDNMVISLCGPVEDDTPVDVG